VQRQLLRVLLDEAAAAVGPRQLRLGQAVERVGALELDQFRLGGFDRAVDLLGDGGAGLVVLGEQAGRALLVLLVSEDLRPVRAEQLRRLRLEALGRGLDPAGVAGEELRDLGLDPLGPGALGPSSLPPAIGLIFSSRTNWSARVVVIVVLLL
jgi:hypothetical protein